MNGIAKIVTSLFLLIGLGACQNPITLDQPSTSGSADSRATTGITVYTSGYTHIYFWSSTPANSPANAAWPGVVMGTDAASGLKTYSFPAATAINIIFSNNGASQTANLSRTTGSWKYAAGVWTAYSTTPTASASPGTSSFSTSTLAVTLSAANPGTGTYKIDSGTATAYTNGQIININGADLAVGATRNLTVTNGTASTTYTYTKSAAPVAGITVYTSAYSHIYFWSSVPANSPANATWPGVAMGTDPASGLKTYSFPNATSINIIFSNNGAGQSADLNRTTGSWLYSGGVWSVYNSNPVPTVSASPGTSSFSTSTLAVTLGASNPASGTYKIDAGTSTTYTNGQIININGADLAVGATRKLTLTNGTASTIYTYTKSAAPVTGIKVYTSAYTHIYYWSSVPANSPVNATWPGAAMGTDAGSGLKTYSFPNATSINIIFSNNGAGQSSDLSRTTGEWLYSGGVWSVYAPVTSASASPAGGSFSTSTSITLNAGNPATGTYKWDSGATTAYTSGTVISAGADWTVGQSKVLTVANGTATNSYTFTKVPISTDTFSWDNASVYFVITDRFYNGDTTNDSSYGRVKVDATGKNIGTFHGGDLKGLKAKLDANYFNDLGVNAIWITAPYEQIHGWVGGGNTGDFAHYAYHGYYPLDYTNMDANMGTKTDLKAFVDTAHAKNIRVVFDIVMNHAGYATMKDMNDFNFGGKKAGFNVNWTPGAGQTWHSYNDLFIDYTTGSSAAWGNWWGKNWVRAGIADYTPGDNQDLTMNLNGLPDFKTENGTALGLPTFLQNKATFGTGYQTAYTASGTKKVSDWIAEWLVKWVRDYGVDGFRVDTAKHVETGVWANLKDQSVAALNAWRAANPTAAGANWTAPFWTTAEVFDHGAGFNSTYHTNAKFNSIINFGYVGAISSNVGNLGGIESTWASYASMVNSNKTDTWNFLSFLDNHDKGSVFFNGDYGRQKNAGSLLLLAPGGVQIYYGDEYGRFNGENGSDSSQGSRSSINWTTVASQQTDSASTLKHWQQIGKFRAAHKAVGGGDHAKLTGVSSGYGFTRIWDSDKVAVVIGASANTSVTVPVSTVFANGTIVRNAYDGTTATVTGGTATFNSGINGTILIEVRP